MIDRWRSTRSAIPLGEIELCDQKIGDFSHLVESKKGRTFASDGESPATAMILLSSGASAIRKISNKAGNVAHLSFKSQEYRA